MALTRAEKNYLHDRLKKLRIRNKISRQDPANREARLHYLRGVYAFARTLAQAVKDSWCARELGGDEHTTSHVEFIDLVMQETSKDDRRLKSKHGGALKEAAYREIKAADLQGFYDEGGGLTGRSNRWFRRVRKAALKVD